MSINQIISTAQSALTAQKALMQIAGKNVANAGSQSYSRQRLDLLANAVPGLSVLQGSLSAVRSPTIHRSLLGATQGFGYHQGKQEVLHIAELAVNDMEKGGVSEAIDAFFTAVSELSGNPTGAAERQQLLSMAQSLTTSIRKSATSLTEARDAAFRESEIAVKTVNELMKAIASLNQEIAIRQGSADPGAELVDQRDVLLGQLAKHVDIQTLEKADGTVSVYLASGPVLVDRELASKVGLSGGGTDPLSISVTRADGSVLAPLSPPGGRLGGLFEARDKVLKAALDKLDQLAFGFAEKFNAIHAGGVGLDGSTGLPLFEPPVALQGAALGLSVSAAVQGNPEKIAAAQDPNLLPGDDANILAMLALQDDATAVAGAFTFAGGYDAVVQTVTHALNDAAGQVETQQARVAHFEAARASLSGVSIQEEMVALSQAEHAFQAATRVVEVADQLFDAVLRMV